ncbi:hypothetical protein [Lactiplantibacillus pentosus]|uniref:hypothetical protein n=1 Tax=Lactiplantibacillus pentosus TaxID=1589 RepID=UPI0015E5AC1D|nr:hypothetical protein [Lactiplantibacillus pentosus]
MSVGKRLRALLATALVSVMSLFMGGMAQSAEADSAVGFEISPVRSSSQVDSNVSYFDLKSRFVKLS